MAAAATVGNVAVTLDGNTAGALALVSSGTLTMAGGNNITLSQAGNAITISGANAGGAQTGISGIANSEATYTSGTVELVGTGAITIASNAGQQFVFSVNSQSVQPETQTFIGGISASDTLYTSGTVRITGVGGGVTVSSNTGQRIDISVAAQSVQPETQTFISGISASDTLYTSGNVRFTGVGGGVTVSSNTGQRVDISVAAQSVQPETQTFIAGISASDTLYTSGNVRFTGVGGGITVSSNTGQRVDLSVAAQSVQPETQTFVAGIQNSQTTYTSGTVNLSVVAGNLTIRSTTGQAFQFSMSQTVQAETQTAISGIANSQTTYTSGTVSLSELGAITIRSTTGNQYQFSVNSQTVQTQGILSAGVSTGGNTAGNTQVSTGSRLVIVGSNGITASQGTAAGATTITLSGITQSVQTNDIPRLGVSTGGNTAGDTTVNSGTRLVFVGSNNITLSQGTAASATTITISGPTTAAQTVQTQGILSAGVSTGGNTAGNTTVNTGSRLVFVGSNMVSLSQTTGAGATTISFNATQTVQTNDIPRLGVSTGGNTSGDTTVNSGTRFVLVGSNGITLSQGTAASATTVTISGITQSVQTQGILNVALSNIGNTSGDTGLNSGTRMVLAGGNNITLSASSAANATTITISAGAGGAYSAGMSTNGNTSGDTGFASQRLALMGGNNITLSGSTNGGSMSITISAPNLGAGAMSAGVSTGGNTAGATGITGTQLVLVGTGPVSLSQTTGANGGTVSINAPATSSLSATGQVQISTNGSTISVGVPNPLLSYRWIEDRLLMGATQGIGASAATQTTVTAWVQPVSIPTDFAFNNLLLAAHNSFSSATTSISSVNYSFSMGASVGFYTLSDSSMSLVTSFSNSLGYSNATAANVTNMSLTARVGYGGSSTTKSTQGGANMTAIMSSINSVRQIPMNWTTISNTLTRGQYWAVVAFSALTGGANQASLSQVGYVSNFSIIGSAINPPELMQNTASVTSPYPFLGQATLVNSSNSLMPVSFNTSVITTATAIANSTKFQSIWMRIYSSHSN
jgi:hypothetical protein